MVARKGGRRTRWMDNGTSRPRLTLEKGEEEQEEKRERWMATVGLATTGRRGKNAMMCEIADQTPNFFFFFCEKEGLGDQLAKCRIVPTLSGKSQACLHPVIPPFSFSPITFSN